MKSCTFHKINATMHLICLMYSSHPPPPVSISINGYIKLPLFMYHLDLGPLRYKIIFF